MQLCTSGAETTADDRDCTYELYIRQDVPQRNKQQNKANALTLSGSVSFLLLLFMRVYKVEYVDGPTEGAVEAERDDVAVATRTVWSEQWFGLRH